ncbi:glycoside hydrolase family 20 protein [Dyella subtropica]|uniref:glycoside hydrolase family 20 protein n=1 Tax=Dyella subtropica TaxID=2992127 RepID=UPI00225B8CDC|nr:family 20 glycosylhydrolase [Dyella subtropica]
MIKRMKGRVLLGVFALMSASFAHAELSLIPYPQHLEQREGRFVLDRHTTIDAPADARSQEIAGFLRVAIREQTGVTVPEQANSDDARIALRIDPSVRGDEAYRLTVTPKHITLSASNDKGLFWGVQTLRQLMPQEPSGQGGASIPAVRIEDAPAFVYRGHMLDVGRHFYPVAFIKKQLDLMSYYKLNTFRLHLTEDQGWRIEIKKYPKLTEVGAWRTEADGSRSGGFYTQNQIRSIVEYARKRNIMVIPEIEMPGHSSAAIASYPELSCAKKPIPVPTGWGVFKDVYCVGDEAAFTFVQDVLDEIIPLFPAPYVHIGGDEVPAGAWANCTSCEPLKQKLGIKDEAGLQSYFVKRIQTCLAGKGKTMIGWDEILEGGVDRSAVIEVWRGETEGRKALANGNRIINAGPYYLDSPLLKLTVEGVYRTDPLGDADYVAHREQVLGAEAPLWSERADPSNAEAKLYPRLLAFADRLWKGGKPDDAGFADFQQRLRAQYPRLDAWNVAYGPEGRNVVDYDLSLDAQHDGWQLRAQRGFDDLRIHYTTDGSEPTSSSPSFTDALEVKAPGTLRVTPFRRGHAYDHSRTFELSRNLAFGKPVQYEQQPSPTYAKNSATAMTDGVLGSNDFHDGAWMGWEEVDPRLTVDLGQVTEMHDISIGVLQQAESWVWWPSEVSFSVSDDQVHWQSLQTSKPAPAAAESQVQVQRVAYSAAQPFSARYVRVEMTRRPSLDGRQTWTFADEILVR